MKEKKIKKRAEQDFTQGVLWKQILRFFFPMWFGMVFQALYSAVDALVVGRMIGSNALAAVSNTSIVITMLVGLFSGLAAGSTILVAQFYGSRDRNRVHICAQTSMFLSLAFGAAIMLLSFFLTPWLVRIINTPQEIYADSVSYLKIYAIGIVPMAIYNLGSGIMRGMGDSQRPVYILIAASVVNIVLDIVLVKYIPMGVPGVAIATTVSQFVSAVIMIILLARGDSDSLRLSLKEYLPRPGMVKLMLQVGVPTAVQSSTYNFTNILIQAGINGFGTAAIAAWGTYGKVDMIFWLTLTAMSNTLTTIVGQNYGANQRKRMIQCIHTTLWMCTVVTAVASLVLVFFYAPLFGIFTDDPEVILHGGNMVRHMAPFYILFTIEETYFGAVRATGDSFWPMILNLISICLMRVAWVLIVLPVHHSINTLFWSYPISWGVGAILAIGYYKMGRWDRQKQLPNSLEA